MSEYKRLTRRTKEFGIITLCSSCSKQEDCIIDEEVESEDCIDEAYNRLAELEDKICEGTLYAFPFRIGQKVYIVCDWDIGEAVEGIITEIELTTNKNGTFHKIYVDHKYIFSKTNPNVVKYRYIFMADELFTDKTKAEARLKELRGKQK